MPGNFYHFYESNGIRVLSIFERLNSGYIASHILPLMAIGVLHIGRVRKVKIRPLNFGQITTGASRAHRYLINRTPIPVLSASFGGELQRFATNPRLKWAWSWDGATQTYSN